MGELLARVRAMLLLKNTKLSISASLDGMGLPITETPRCSQQAFSKAIGERTLAMRHMHSIKSKMRTNLLYTLFVFDRGYPSKNLIAYVEDEIKAQYLFRLRSKFNNRIDGLPGPQSPDGIADCTINLDGRPVS